MKPASFLDFFRNNPWLGVVGSIASIIGIVLAVYFYFAAREKPELTYLINPAKAAVVRAGQTSKLKVQFGDEDVTSDITAAQIAFWNAGDRPIRKDSVLRKLVISTADHTPILEATLRKTSRDVTEISLNDSRLAQGELEVSWKILETDDGGVVQLIYAGDESVELKASAILVGQTEIGEGGGYQAPETTILFVLMVFMLAVLYAGFKRLQFKRYEYRTSSPYFGQPLTIAGLRFFIVDLIMIGSQTGLVSTMIYISVMRIKSPIPPFGF